MGKVLLSNANKLIAHDISVQYYFLQYCEYINVCIKVMDPVNKLKVDLTDIICRVVNV